MTTNFSNYITTPVTLITGSDDKGNEYAYAKSSFVPDGWIDLHNERNTTKRYVANHIIPNVVKVRFGNIEMTRQEWEANGCPFELSREQMQAAELEQHKAMQIVTDVTAPNSDPRITRREFILAAFRDESLTMDEAMELYRELAEIDQALQFHPSDTCQDYISAAWDNMQEVEF